MINQIFNLFKTAFNAVTNWFLQITNASGIIGTILMTIAIMLVVRFIINPFLKSGVGKSDSVVERYKKSQKEKD